MRILTKQVKERIQIGAPNAKDSYTWFPTSKVASPSVVDLYKTTSEKENISPL